MYKILTVSDKIRVPPSNFDLDLESAMKQSLDQLWLRVHPAGRAPPAS